MCERNNSSYPETTILEVDWQSSPKPLTIGQSIISDACHSGLQQVIELIKPLQVS